MTCLEVLDTDRLAALPMQLALLLKNSRHIDKRALMESGKIKGVADDTVVHVPGNVSLEGVSALLGVEAGPIAVESAAALLRGNLDADCRVVGLV